MHYRFSSVLTLSEQHCPLPHNATERNDWLGACVHTCTLLLLPVAEDEKIVNVTEVLHNLPFLPQLLRSVWTTLITTAGLTVSGW